MFFISGLGKFTSNFCITLHKSTHYTKSTCISALWMLSLLGYLIFSKPNYSIENKPAFVGPCPPVSGVMGTDSHYHTDIVQDKQIIVPLRSVSCGKIIKGEMSEVNFTQPFNWCTRSHSLKESDYVEETKDCDKFKDKFGYNLHHISDEEKAFPIAFSILTHESVEQTERLLRAIWRPTNVYCIHIDGKAPSVFLEAMLELAKCFPNVIVPKHPVIVHWAEMTVLQAELLCLKRLWDYEGVKWKYFINLTGREYPLRTNKELVKILQAYNGANDIDGNRYNRNRDWTDYVWRAENWRTNVKKEPVPHGYNIHKGSAHIVASRDFVDYVLHNPDVNDLKEWMRDTRLPDEHFFNTLNHNPQFNVPGAYKVSPIYLGTAIEMEEFVRHGNHKTYLGYLGTKNYNRVCCTDGDPGLKPFYARLKLWWENKESKCSGEWSRYICNLGTEELARVTTAKHMFVNKIVLEMAPVAYQCLEQWYWNRTKQEQITGDVADNAFDLKFYKSLKIVSEHV